MATVREHLEEVKIANLQKLLTSQIAIHNNEHDICQGFDGCWMLLKA